MAEVASLPSLAGLGFPPSFFCTDISFAMSSSGLAVAGSSLLSFSGSLAAVSGSRSAGCGGAVPAELSGISLPSASIIRVLVSYRVWKSTLPASAATCSSFNRLPS